MKNRLLNFIPTLLWISVGVIGVIECASGENITWFSYWFAYAYALLLNVIDCIRAGDGK